MGYWGRALFAIILFGLGFVWPLMFLVAIVIAYSIYDDLRARTPAIAPSPSEADGPSNSFDREIDALDPRSDLTESIAEQAFLDAMIERHDLKSVGFAVEGKGIKLEMQKKILKYRVDFLLNGWLVIEIDGAEWHSLPSAVERDRNRDAALKEIGYSVLRIAAKTALYKPEQALRDVEIAMQRPTEPFTAFELLRHEKEKARSQRPSGSILARFSDAMDHLDNFMTAATERQKVEDILKGATSAFETECALVEAAIESAKRDMEIEGMCLSDPEFGRHYGIAKQSLEQTLAAVKGKYQGDVTVRHVLFKRPELTGDHRLDEMVQARFVELNESRERFLDDTAAAVVKGEYQAHFFKALASSSTYITQLGPTLRFRVVKLELLL